MPERTICWEPVWNRKQQGGLEHLLLAEQTADGMVLAFDDGRRPFRLAYRLSWDDDWSVREADLVLTTDRGTRSLNLQTDGRGRWRYRDGKVIHALDGSLDIDIWPTPFTNTFPIRRVPMDVRERREFRLGIGAGPDFSAPGAGIYTARREALSIRKPRRQRVQGEDCGG